MTTQQLLHQELSRLFNIEAHLAEALPNIAESVQNRKLWQVLKADISKTRRQADRLKEAGYRLNLDVNATLCVPVQALIHDLYKVAATQLTSEARDAMLANKLRLIKNYEAISCETAYQHAQKLGHTILCQLLDATRQEKRRAELKLGYLAMNCLNVHIPRVYQYPKSPYLTHFTTETL